jgi:peptidyl-prolyl cis-trans isomerase SurA
MRQFLAVILTSVVISGPASAQKVVDEIVARVNVEIVLKSEYESAKTELRGLIQREGVQGPQVEREYEERLKNLLRDMVDQSLLMQKAKEMDLNADLEVVKSLERLRQEYNFSTTELLEKAIVEQGSTVEDFKQNIRSQYLSSQVLGREVDSKIVVTTEQIRNYYETHTKDFDRPEGVRLREITVLTKDKTPEQAAQQKQKAEEALAAIKRGDDFVQVVQKYSESQSVQNGGDLGFFQKGQLAKFLEDVAARIEKGQVSELLTLEDAFMIVKVEDKHSGGILAFELAQDEIQDRLWRERRAPRIREYLTRLRTEGFVEIRDGYVDTGAAGKISEAKSQ